jgi:hypothetical protein
MKVIAAWNPSRTVGLCGNMTSEEMRYIGTYPAKDLLLWATKLAQMYEDTPVMVYERMSSSVNAKMLSASTDGKDPFVCITSQIESSGKKVLK